jgi:predicted DNA-binding antitoxin AbrB/MazE fold protein
MTIHAIYENGIFRPTEPVNLPDKTPVEFEPKIVSSPNDDAAAQRRVYELLRRSIPSGHHDTAERHDEHQP